MYACGIIIRWDKKGNIGLGKRMKGFGFLHVILSPKML